MGRRGSGLFLFVGLVGVRIARRRDIISQIAFDRILDLILDALHAFPEFHNALADGTTYLWKALAEDEERHNENYYKLSRTYVENDRVLLPRPASSDGARPNGADPVKRGQQVREAAGSSYFCSSAVSGLSG